MEQQAVNNQVQQAPVNPASPKPGAEWYLAKSNYCIIGGIILILLLILSTIYVRSLPSRKPISPPPKPLASPPPTSPTPDPTANWKTYISPDNAFSFKYPSDWEYEVTDFVFIIKGKEYPTTYIRFGKPVTEKERRQFGYIDINDAPKVYNNFSLQYASHTDFTNLTVDNLVEELINKRSSDVDDPRTLLLNNSIQAKEVGYACQESCVDILFKNNTTIFDASTGPSGSTLTQRQILSTFKFLDQENQVVCTQDVKECPDGSYVSRQPPTCEFAPCP